MLPRAQSTVTLNQAARRGGFYDAQGRPLTGLETLAASLLPGAGKITTAPALQPTPPGRNRCTAAAAGRLHFSWRDRHDGAGHSGYPAARRYAAAPLCLQLLGYLDGEGHGAAGLEKALDALLTGSGARDTLLCPVTAQGTLRTREQVQHLQADSGAVGVRLTLSRSVQRAAEAVAAQTMTTGCILVLDVRTQRRACVSVPGFDPADPAASLEAPDSPFLNRALQAYAVGSVFKPVLAAAALGAALRRSTSATARWW